MSEAVVGEQHVTTSTRGFGRRSVWGLARSEWVKLRAQPANWVLFGVAAVLTIGYNVLVVKALTGLYASVGVTAVPADDVRSLLVAGWQLGILILGILAVRSDTTEYSTLSRASSLIAVPRRWSIVAAKALVLAVVFAVFTVIVNLVDHGLIALTVGSQNMPAFFSAGYLGLFWGSAATAALIAVFGVGIGEIVRSTAGGITAWIVLFYVANLPLQLVSSRWAWAGWLSEHWISAVLSVTLSPITAAQSAVVSQPTIGAWPAFASLAVWAVVALALGIWRAERSDV